MQKSAVNVQMRAVKWLSKTLKIHYNIESKKHNGHFIDRYVFYLDKLRMFFIILTYLLVINKKKAWFKEGFSNDSAKKSPASHSHGEHVEKNEHLYERQEDHVSHHSHMVDDFKKESVIYR